jgi:hypothetical protein
MVSIVKFSQFVEEVKSEIPEGEKLFSIATKMRESFPQANVAQELYEICAENMEAMTRGMRNAISKKAYAICKACEYPIPKYKGRYPGKCPECGEELDLSKNELDLSKNEAVFGALESFIEEDLKIIREEIEKRASLAKALREFGENSTNDILVFNSACARVFIQLEKSGDKAEDFKASYIEAVKRILHSSLTEKDVQSIKKFFLNVILGEEYKGMDDGCVVLIKDGEEMRYQLTDKGKEAFASMEELDADLQDDFDSFKDYLKDGYVALAN